VFSDVRVVPDTEKQIEALFHDGWDARSVALIEREPAASGTAGEPAPPSATVLADSANRVVVEAAAGGAGGYLLLLDSYSDDWRVDVDGQPASMVRANGLFRAVRLVAGRHVVEFVYRPRAFFAGLEISAAALLVLVALYAWPSRRARVTASPAAF
jgi:hypothetical protein